MPVPSSGAISLNQFHVEAGGTSGTTCSINDSDIRGLIGKASGVTMSFNEWYGASASVPNQVTGNLVYYVPPNSKYNEKNWTMTSFTDSTLGSYTVERILIATSSLINSGEIRIVGNVSSYSTLQALVGYRYMKIGSTTILDLSSQGAVTMYLSGLNVTKFPIIAHSASPAQSTQTTTFTFAN